MKNSISFRLWGRHALFTDPVTRIGGEKCSYHLPTYEAIKGVLKSIYWKPTLIWHVDKVRVIKLLRTQTKGVKPVKYHGIYPSDKDSLKKQVSFHDLAIYTFLQDVEYQVQAHFEWNEHRPELAKDRIDGKHYSIVQRMLERGGRQDIFLGTRDCQAYVEPCEFGTEKGAYDDIDELAFGLMFHSFAYPDETGIDELHSRFWHATMKKGILEFPRPENCPVSRFVRPMRRKPFGIGSNLLAVEDEENR
ncbi:type I-C CRISPR-associated protein Cas5c [Methylotuvimicrobium buryatense]|uniref:pre-crRNA processing endonuclease n=1 Tax=Methylotuvimicrobium buryatense TaxID=95641 RepID=A0A4P9UMZ8_METBY|nr:type I-C CRISPR-associated protein Cas5c [Methylotuvimicrobium buryatense]QCW82684.1 type I-C CRISPR-associated protein Cas5 [Methylotuvimicrobium buryatense]